MILMSEVLRRRQDTIPATPAPLLALFVHFGYCLGVFAPGRRETRPWQTRKPLVAWWNHTRPQDTIPATPACRCSAEGLGYGVKVQGLGVKFDGCLRVQGLGFGVWDLGFGGWGLGFGVSVTEFRVSGSGFEVRSFGFRVWSFGFGVSGFGLRASGFGLTRDRGEPFSCDSGMGFGVYGLGFSVWVWR